MSCQTQKAMKIFILLIAILAVASCKPDHATLNDVYNDVMRNVRDQFPDAEYFLAETRTGAFMLSPTIILSDVYDDEWVRMGVQLMYAPMGIALDEGLRWDEGEELWRSEFFYKNIRIETTYIPDEVIASLRIKLQDMSYYDDLF